MPMYLERLLQSESAAVWPGWKGDILKLLGAHMSSQVASKTRHYLLENGKFVIPSGRLSSSRDRPVGSKIDGKPAASRARLIASSKA